MRHAVWRPGWTRTCRSRSSRTSCSRSSSAISVTQPPLSSRLPEQHDAVGVGPLGVVIDTPARSGLRELLRIDQHQDRVQPRTNPAPHDVLLEANTAGSNLTHLECHVAARLHHASQFQEYL